LYVGNGAGAILSVDSANYIWDINAGSSIAAGSWTGAGLSSLTIKSKGGGNLEIVDRYAGDGPSILSAKIADGANVFWFVSMGGEGGLTLSGANTYKAPTILNGTGPVAIDAESRLGNNPSAFKTNHLFFVNGTLRTTATFSIDDTNRGIGLGYTAGGGADFYRYNLYAGGTFAPDPGTTLTIANVIAGQGFLAKASNGTLRLTATNTYSGRTYVNAGTLLVGFLTNGAANCAIGAASNDACNLVLNGGALQYTGKVASIDRLFTVTAAGGTLDASGSGALSFTNPGVISPDPANRTFTASGSNKRLTALPSTSDLAVGMNVSGSGIPAGATIASIDSASQVTLNASANIAAGTGVTARFGYASRTLTLAGANTGANMIGGILQDSANGADGGVTPGVLSLVKSGAGAWVLGGTNSYTGNTTINGGTLTLASTGALRFRIEDASNTRLSGTGNAVLNGTLLIDIDGLTSAPTSKAWNLVDVTNLTETFNLAGVAFSGGGAFTPSGPGSWKRDRWCFDEATGNLWIPPMGTIITVR
jgi:fibronectin-binding autotransporter adhesin